MAVIDGGAEMDEFSKPALFSLLVNVLYADPVGLQSICRAFGTGDCKELKELLFETTRAENEHKLSISPWYMLFFIK